MIFKMIIASCLMFSGFAGLLVGLVSLFVLIWCEDKLLWIKIGSSGFLGLFIVAGITRLFGDDFLRNSDD